MNIVCIGPRTWNLCTCIPWRYCLPYAWFCDVCEREIEPTIAEVVPDCDGEHGNEDGCWCPNDCTWHQCNGASTGCNAATLGTTHIPDAQLRYIPNGYPMDLVADLWRGCTAAFYPQPCTTTSMKENNNAKD